MTQREWIESVAGKARGEPPRLLTEAEKDELLSDLPLVFSPDPTAAFFARSDIILILRRSLANVKIVPQALPDLKKKLIIFFEKARIHPGTNPGITAAEAVGAITSQMALKSFHTAGSSNSVAVGIRALEEVIYCVVARQLEVYNVYFKNENISHDDILGLRGKIINITISRLLNVGQETTQTPDELYPNWWRDGYALLYGKTIPKCERVLRLVLNVDEMFRLGVTANDISEALEGGVVGDSAVICICSPSSYGIIDVYPKSERLRMMASELKISTGMSDDVFLATIVLPQLSKIRIRGVPGITAIEPQTAPILSVVSLQVKIPLGLFQFYFHSFQANYAALKQEDVKDTYLVVLSDNRSRTTGISPLKVGNFLQRAGLVFLGLTNIADRAVHQVAVLSRQGAPLDVARGKLSAAQARRDVLDKRELALLGGGNVSLSAKDKSILKDFKTNTMGELVLSPEDELLLRTGNISYALMIGQPRNPAKAREMKDAGKTLVELMALEMVDANKTYNNNVFDITEVLGIEAAFNFLCKELNDVITNSGSSVNPHHILIIVSVICFRGRPHGLTYTGIAGQAAGPLTQATLANQKRTFKEAGLFGSSESVDTVSAAIMTGQIAPVGSGIVKTLTDTKVLQEWVEARGQIKITDETIENLESITEDDDASYSYTNLRAPLQRGEAVDLSSTLENKMELANEGGVRPINIVRPVGVSLTGKADAPVTPSHRLVPPLVSSELKQLVSEIKVQNLPPLVGITDVKVKELEVPQEPKIVAVKLRAFPSWIIADAKELKSEIDYASMCVVDKSEIVSILPRQIAQFNEAVAEKVKLMTPTTPSFNIVDAVAHVGVDTLNLLNLFPTVRITALEANENTYKCLAENISRFAKGRAVAIRSTLTQWLTGAEKMERTVIFMTPAWPDGYATYREVPLHIDGQPIEQVLRRLMDRVDGVILRAPNNFDHNLLRDFAYTTVDVFKEKGNAKGNIYFTLFFINMKQRKPLTMGRRRKVF